MANQEKDHGIELYEELPPIRKTLLGQVQALEHPSWNPICSIFFLTTKKWIFFLEKCLDKVLWHSDGCILFWFWFYYYFTGCERTEGFFISMFAATVTEVSSCSKSTDLKWIKKQKKQRTFTEYFIRYSIANTAQMKLDGMIWASMYCHMHNNI